jgi:hypothetical protein
MKLILIKFLLPIKSIIFLCSEADLYFPEFEEVLINPDKRISNKYDNFYIIDNEQELWNHLLETLSKVVNYDRMMVYKFMMDGSGKVIAERKNEDMESFLGLHYPESDIPKQARSFILKKEKESSVMFMLIQYRF